MEYLVYLAGPILGQTYQNATSWRDYVRHATPSYIHTLSPLRAKEFLGTAQGPIGMTYDEHPLTAGKGINHRDYFDVQRCDALFVNLYGAKKVSIGTVMEIAWARAFNKPVVCVMEPGNIHDHTMLTFPCSYIVEDLDEGIHLLKSLLSTDTQLTLQQEKRIINDK